MEKNLSKDNKDMLSWIEVSRKAVLHNIKIFRSVIGKDRSLIAVIKANAYGHGMKEIAKICESSTAVDMIAVVNSDEAQRLLEMGIKKPIMILSYFSSEQAVLSQLIKNKVRFPVYRLDQFSLLEKEAKRLGCKINIHLKIDTGTTRVGFMPNELDLVVEKIIKCKHLYIEGLWSHFASSEDNPNYTKEQIRRFEYAVSWLNKQGIQPQVKHMSCSAAIVSAALKPFTAARLGLSLYGLHPSKRTSGLVELQPVLSWKTKIIQIKQVPKGTPIGYGGSYITKKKSTIAVLPIGYFDGYDRKLSNCGYVIIGGKKCPVRGRICMNLMMVDITNVQQAKVSDEVVLIGKQGTATITAEELADQVETINYEIVSRLGQHLPRIIV